MNRRLLLDQMLDAHVAEALRNGGHDVVRVSEVGMARSGDDEILTRAIADRRVLITLDHHFGDWAVLPLEHHPGVIRVKADPATTQRVLDILKPFLVAHTDRDYSDFLVIVRPTGVRWIKTCGT